MMKAIQLSITAGKTTVVNKNSKPNGISNLNMNNARLKKIEPDIIVLIPIKTTFTTIFCVNFFINRITTNKKRPVMALSTTFGKKPPGVLENSPEIIPVDIASKNVSLNVGNNRIPINIITSMMSGFTPPLMPGITT